MEKRTEKKVIYNSFEELVRGLRVLSANSGRVVTDMGNLPVVMCELCNDEGYVMYDAFQEGGEIRDAIKVKCSCQN